MHAAGGFECLAEQLITEDDIRTFINSGADIICFQLQERSRDLVRICAKWWVIAIPKE